MAYFAQIDETDTVINVIAASQEFIDSGAVGDPAIWIEYKKDGSIKKNPARIGGTIDKNKDAFIDKKPFDSWVLDEKSMKWKAPKVNPQVSAEELYEWDESKLDWVKLKDRLVVTELTK